MKNRTSKDNTIVRKKVQTRRFNADIRYGLNSDQVNEYLRMVGLTSRLNRRQKLFRKL